MLHFRIIPNIYGLTGKNMLERPPYIEPQTNKYSVIHSQRKGGKLVLVLK